MIVWQLEHHRGLEILGVTCVIGSQTITQGGIFFYIVGIIVLALKNRSVLKKYFKKSSKCDLVLKISKNNGAIGF
jgi:hypothetical protein